MRNPNRLYNVYNYLMDIHMNYYPDLRLGQFFEFIKKKIYDEYRQDIFYLEDEELLNKIKKFIDRELIVRATPIAQITPDDFPDDIKKFIKYGFITEEEVIEAYSKKK